MIDCFAISFNSIYVPSIFFTWLIRIIDLKIEIYLII